MVTRSKRQQETLPDPLAAAAAKAGLSTAALDTVRAWLMEQFTANLHARLSEAGYAGKKPTLDKVFVDLPFHCTTGGLNGGILGYLLLSAPQTVDTLRYVEESDGAASLNPDMRERTQSYPHSLPQEIQFASVLLIGGPGQGKSTIGQMACQLHRVTLLQPKASTLTSGQREQLTAFASVQRHEMPHYALPLQISLPKLAPWLRHTEYDASPWRLLHFLTEQADAKHVNLDTDNLRAVLSQLPVLLNLDGFDEVGAGGDRERIVVAVRDFLQALHQQGTLVQVLAATRPQGYNDELAKIGICLTRCRLEFLDQAAAMQVGRRMITTLMEGKNQQEQLLQNLEGAANEGTTARLLQTPLQVGILVSLLEQIGRVPRARWRLFDDYFDIMFKREVARGSYASSLLHACRTEIERIHQQAGLVLQVEAEKENGKPLLGREQLLDLISAILTEEGISLEQCTELSQELLRVAEERLVFLVEQEPNQFGFDVRSLQEFCCAQALLHGREQEIQDRLWAIAHASMFHNVLLFMISKFFADGGPWREYVIDELCPELNQKDDAAKIVLPGSYLALDILEEGMADGQPKRARGLVACMCGLLKTAISASSANAEQTCRRMLAVLSDETEDVFKEQLERAIQGSAHLNMAWLVLVCASNQGKQWAGNIGEQYWGNIQDITQWLRDAGKFKLKIDHWLKQKILQNADRLDFVDFCHWRVSGDQHENTWVDWLMQSFEMLERRIRHKDDVYYISDLESLSLPPPTAIPENWKMEYLLMKANVRIPNVELAEYLEYVGDIVQNQKSQKSKRVPARLLTWPIYSALQYCHKHPKYLCDFARELRESDNPSFDDLLAAQNIKRNFDWRNLLLSYKQKRPWDKKILKNGIPYFAFGWNDLSNEILRNGQFEDFLIEASALLPSLENENFRVILAIIVLRVICQEKNGNGLHIECLKRSLDVYPAGIDFLIPKPKWLPLPMWENLLDRGRPISGFHIYPENDEAFVTHFHPQVLRLALICGWPKRMSVRKNPAWKAQLDKYENKTSPEWMILAIWFGILPPEQDFLVVDVIAGNSWDEEQPRRYVEFLLKALEHSPLPDSRKKELLLQLWPKLDDSELSARGKCLDILQDMQMQIHSSLVAESGTLHLSLPIWTQTAQLDGNWLNTPIILQSLSLDEIRGFDRLHLDFPAPQAESGQWIVFLGQNGVGKTTLLRSIALALRNVDDRAIWPEKSFVGLPRCDDSGKLATKAAINLALSDGSKHGVEIQSNGSSWFKAKRPHNLQTHGLVFGYGCRRGSATGDERREYSFDINKNGPEIATLFDEHKGLVPAQAWLRELQLTQPDLCTHVCAALCGFLDVEKFELDGTQLYVKQMGQPRLALEQMSDGYLTTAGWLLDLLARWIDYAQKHGLQPGADFTQQMRGLVLIDEIDMHLHPRWQVEIIRRTRKLMPAMSFIVTTHNPLTLVGAKAEEIWILENQAGKIVARQGEETPMLLTGGGIYTEYFGLDSIYPDGLGEKLQDYHFLSRYAARDDAQEQQLQELSEILRQENLLPEWPVVPREKKGRNKRGKA